MYIITFCVNYNLKEILKIKINNFFRIDEPCAPKGSVLQQSFKGLFGTACTQFLDYDFMQKVSESKGKITFIGSGDISRCRVSAANKFNYTLCTET